jgi:hypothetical protein
MNISLENPTTPFELSLESGFVLYRDRWGMRTGSDTVHTAVEGETGLTVQIRREIKRDLTCASYTWKKPGCGFCAV